jgi:alpha-mannosidase
MSMSMGGPEDPDHTLTRNEGSSGAVQPQPLSTGEDQASDEAEVDRIVESAGETSPTAEAEPLAPRTGWRLFGLIPHEGKEPAAGLADDLAQACWCAVSALWHPSLLARAAQLPIVQPVETPTAPETREIRIIPATAVDRLPSGYRTQAEDAGAVLFEADANRTVLIRQIQERLGAVGTPETSLDPAMVALAEDFLALGTSWWMLRDLAIAMGHPDAINHQALTREVLGGADAWQNCDRTTAVNRLRAGFEVLTQARERFYPVDAYLVDLCLLDPAMPAGVLEGPLDTHVAVTLVAPARAIERQASVDPERLEQLRQAITEGWVDVAGGPYAETEDLVLPLESILWQFRRGGEVYREHLEERSVETYARRRFGLYTQLPQIAKRFGFRFALHLGFDAGRFPVRSETKRLWESPDGTSLETMLRPPVAADRPSSGQMLPWRLAATMKNDHVATLPLVHWPAPVSSWYVDLRRGATYSPVLARWVTLNDYFHLTDRPYETFRPDPDSYLSPYLAQAVSRRESEPISRLARHHRLRGRYAGMEFTRAAALVISAAESGSPALLDPSPESVGPGSVESLIESDRHDEAAAALDRLEPIWAERLAHGILEAKTATTPSHRPGYLVINPLGVPRRVAVMLPDAGLDLRPEGPLRAAQFTEHGVSAVVDAPAFGFAWVARETNLELAPPAQGGLSARNRTFKNEKVEVEIDEATGGIRGVMAVGESTARVGQQLVIARLGQPGSKPIVSQMKADRVDVEYAGPALVQATATGTLVDSGSGAHLARFTQRYRLWTGRPILEVAITLSDVDANWLSTAAQSDPWTQYFACRWAWPDPTSMVRRTVLLAPELTELERPETPDAIDISTRRQRTTLLSGGLPYHRKHGGRMLDTLLIAGAETARTFQLGVAVDLEHPFQAALDLITPALVVPTDLGPPGLGMRGWLILVDQKAVAVTHVGFVPSTGEGRGWGLVVHLLETAGQSTRCRVRFFRNPTWARQIDFQSELVVDLTVESDGVLVDLTPNELAQLEVTLA